MLKGIGIGILIGLFASGLLWFFTGRARLGPILETSEAIRTEIRTAQSFGDTLSDRFDGMGDTVTGLSDRGTTIETGSNRISDTSRDLVKRSTTFERGLRSISDSVQTVEGRFGLIVGIVGELRDITEDFRETIESRAIED